MADENIRTLFNEVGDLKVQLTRVETLLVETVIANQKNNTERLDRHRRDIDEAFRQIEEIKHTIEQTKVRALTVRDMVKAGFGLVATSAGIAATVVQFMR